MLTFATTRMRRCFAVLTVTAALAAVLAVASPAKAYTGSPFGHVDTNAGVVNYWPNALPVVSGWAVDPDALTSPIYVRADVTWTNKTCNKLFGCMTYIVGQTSLRQLANMYRADLVGDYPWGTKHGFSIALPLPSLPIGSYNGEQVCVTALNVGFGSNTTFGCYPVVPYPPI